ncbi:hypothetical protein AZF01_01345 [Martelella sp. AD-3]|nr:hypothetical protein AZF01_01345 [Martelella sp. AD-3]
MFFLPKPESSKASGRPGIYAAESEYTILTADGGVSGTFHGVTTTLAYLVPFLDYTSNAVLLRLPAMVLPSSATHRRRTSARRPSP